MKVGTQKKELAEIVTYENLLKEKQEKENISNYKRKLMDDMKDNN